MWPEFKAGQVQFLERRNGENLVGVEEERGSAVENELRNTLQGQIGDPCVEVRALLIIDVSNPADTKSAGVITAC